MTRGEKIRTLRETTGCGGLMDIHGALDKRDGCLECATEYLTRTGLAAVMPEGARYPIWFRDHKKLHIPEVEHRVYPKIPWHHAGEAAPSGVWVATEKIHGAQLVVGANARGARVGKRRAWLEPDEVFFGWQLLRADLESAAQKIRGMLKASTVWLYGELFGGGYAGVMEAPGASPVQTGIWYSPSIEFALFDVLVEDEGEGYFLTPLEVEHFASLGGLMSVPILARGPRAAILDRLTVRYQTHVPAYFGLPDMEGNFAEGFVLKPNARHAPSVRWVSKHKIPEFDEKRFDESMPWGSERRLAVDEMVQICERLMNPARAASARSKVGLAREAVITEMVLDVLVDLEAAFPVAVQGLDGDESDELQARLSELAARVV